MPLKPKDIGYILTVHNTSRVMHASGPVLALGKQRQEDEELKVIFKYISSQSGHLTSCLKKRKKKNE